MKIFNIILFIILQSLVSVVFAQNCSDDIFEIKVTNKNPNETQINYIDKSSSKFMYPPKFASRVPMDRLASFELVSIQKQDSIEEAVFTSKELDTLKRGIAVVQVHVPSGKIASVSFLLQNEVDVDKLKKLKNEFENNLHFNVKLSAELEEEGYWGRSFRIFVSRRRK